MTNATPTTTTITFDMIRRAHDDYCAHLNPTASYSYPLLNHHFDREIILKHENTQPTGAFKVRGGLALFALRGTAALEPGIISASTGNHAQSMAYAATQHNTRCTIVMPQDTPADRAEAVELLGATVELVGMDMSQSLAHARAVAAATGQVFIAPTEYEIIAGHAGVYVELFTDHTDLDAVFVPIGSGSGAAGACLVRNELSPTTKIIGVQSAQAPAAHRAWKDNDFSGAPATTFALGLATSSACTRTQEILRTHLDDFLLVDDPAIEQAQRILATTAHTLAEGAGAVALAGLAAYSPMRTTAAIISGGNATAGEIAGLASATTAV